MTSTLPRRILQPLPKTRDHKWWQLPQPRGWQLPWPRGMPPCPFTCWYIWCQHTKICDLNKQADGRGFRALEWAQYEDHTTVVLLSWGPSGLTPFPPTYPRG